jgi:hypothetical protein
VDNCRRCPAATSFLRNHRYPFHWERKLDNLSAALVDAWDQLQAVDPCEGAEWFLLEIVGR